MDWYFYKWLIEDQNSNHVETHWFIFLADELTGFSKMVKLIRNELRDSVFIFFDCACVELPISELIRTFSLTH